MGGSGGRLPTRFGLARPSPRSAARCGKAANRALNRVQVAPPTSGVGRLYPSGAYVTLGGEWWKAMADQLAKVSKPRLRDRPGRLGSEDLGEVERAIRLQLGMT